LVELTRIENTPLTVGVPDRSPDEDKVIPVGRLPDTTANVNVVGYPEQVNWKVS